MLDLIRRTPNLTWLQLTKRAERLKVLQDIPSNAWIGITAENQKRFLERVNDLREVDADVRWVSYEPALGGLDLSVLQPGDIQWLVCGCESGPMRRPMDVAWARRALAQCRELGIHFFMKQMEVNGEVTDEMDLFPVDLRVREYPEVTSLGLPFGKSAA